MEFDHGKLRNQIENDMVIRGMHVYSVHVFPAA